MGLGMLLWTACSSVPVAQVDQEALSHYRDTGYPSGAERALQTQRINAAASEAPWSASLTRPADSAAHPLIIYLPSLGEADDAPNRWVTAWARAGYAVLVIQPLAEDAQVWASPEARSGDFERAATARFQAQPMTERLARLSAILGEIRERSQRGEAGLQALDWSDVALAGVDLGAYTVQTIATAPAASLAAISWPIAPLAYLAISPYALRNAPVAEHAGAAHAPVLMISSPDDIDADGVITDASLRRLAFDRLGQGDNYYFELGSATHRWLEGVVLPTASAEPAARHTAPLPNADRKSRRGGAASARDAMAPESDEDESAQDKSATSATARAQLAKARSRAMTQEALSEVSLAAVSTAFFDAYVRRQGSARSWLAGPAGKWLQNGDRLKHR